MVTSATFWACRIRRASSIPTTPVDQPSRCRARRHSIRRDHQRDASPARHRIADGPLPRNVMARPRRSDRVPDRVAIAMACRFDSGRSARCAAGFTAVDLGSAWNACPTRGFAVRGAALVAWSRGDAADAQSRFAWSARTPTPPDCASNRAPTPVASVGSNSASRCTAGR